ncbi:MAG TPA: nuclear transport factor 2 family protein [Candidatus Angelobacter sp.]|jgi:hypothetical protein|nr:nuclear transport factor 2 family protein [Candidatus Angelobacter sp.]
MRNNLHADKSTFFAPLCSFVPFVVGLCLLLSGCAGEPKHPTWTNSTGAEQHERLMWKAIQEKGWADFEHHLSATFVGVNAEGKLFDRAGWLEQWKNAPVQDFSLGELQVQPEGPDMKVTYTLQIQATGAAVTTGLQVVSVWQQVKKGWVLSATSMTPIQNMPASH